LGKDVNTSKTGNSSVIWVKMDVWENLKEDLFITKYLELGV